MEENKKDELVVEEKKKENILSKKKEVKGKPLKVWLIVMIVIFMLITFGLGIYFGKEVFNKKEKEKNNEPIPIEEKREETEVIDKEKSNVPVMDNIIVNLYGGGYIYFIVDGSVYYLEADLLDDGRWFLLTNSQCLYDNSDEYCAMNPTYGRKAVKVEGVDNVTRIKLHHNPMATDESFSPFAIDEAGNVYMLSKNQAAKYYGDNNVDDMIAENIFILKDGSKVTEEIVHQIQ